MMDTDRAARDYAVSYGYRDPEDAARAADPYALRDPDARRTRPRRGAPVARSAIAALFAIVLAVVLGGGGYLAWDTLRGPDIGAYANQEITVSGLADRDFTVTPADLAELDCVRLSSTGSGEGPNGESKAGTVDAYGPTMETFLAAYGDGVKETDFKRVVIQCKDGYSVALIGDELGYETVLSIGVGKGALPEQRQPMRLLIPDASSGKWAYGVTRITFER